MIISLLAFLSLLPSVSAQLHRDGEWGEQFKMKVIPIHAMLLPDGQVLAYGTNNRGGQGADLWYEVWDVRSGKHSVSGNHKLLQHSTETDIFCSSLSMDVTTGNILVMGGDHEDNYGVNDVLEFNSRTHQLRKHPKGNMKYARWYGTSVNLPNGNIFIAGGRAYSKDGDGTPSAIPEVWTPQNGFRELPNAHMPGIITRSGWWYPHVYVNSKGDIISIMGLGRNTDVYLIGTDGDGDIKKVGTKPFFSDKLGSSILYRVDKVAMLDNEGVIWEADINDSENPVFTRKRGTGGQARTNAVMSMLPDGRVSITGGCSHRNKEGNTVDCAVKNVVIWDPVENEVFSGPSEDTPRLYHSSGLILPDGTIFSAGGGAPGPLRNLNGQIYSPGYLFNKETGAPATRPEILQAPRSIKAGRTFRIKVDSASKLKKVTALKSGSMTHARNCDARWLDLTYNETLSSRANGEELEVSTPNANIMIPGLWTLYTLDEDGVPAQGHLFRVRP